MKSILEQHSQVPKKNKKGANMKLIFVSLVLFLSGCRYSEFYIGPKVLTKAFNACKDVPYSISAKSTLEVIVNCRNGSSFEYDGVKE